MVEVKVLVDTHGNINNSSVTTIENKSDILKGVFFS